MPKTTKKAERNALAAQRRKIRVKHAAQKAAKRGGASKRLKRNTHPHRRTSALR